MEIMEKVAAVLADRKGVEISDIKPEDTFEDLGLDSLDLADLVMELEDECGVTIELKESIKTVQDLVSYIEEQK